MKLGIVAALVLMIAVAGAAPEASAVHGRSAEGKAPESAQAVVVVKKQSFCLASGISDAYTGNGKVVFYLTLSNEDGAASKVDITPIRHYDDGAINESAMDTLIDVRLPAHSVKKFRSPAYTYKAHEHEVAACGVRINNGREVTIPAIH